MLLGYIFWLLLLPEISPDSGCIRPEKYTYCRKVIILTPFCKIFGNISFITAFFKTLKSANCFLTRLSNCKFFFSLISIFFIFQLISNQKYNILQFEKVLVVPLRLEIRARKFSMLLQKRTVQYLVLEKPKNGQKLGQTSII